MRKPSGFTLIELLIVVAIIGLIAAIAIPNLMNAISRARQKRGMGDVRSIATAVTQYNMDTDFYPTGQTTFGGFSSGVYWALVPDYIHTLPLFDPWQHPYGYAATANGGDMAIVCTGSDGLFQSIGGAGALDPYLTLSASGTNCFENDIIWVNTAFIRYPQGKQKKCN